MKSEKVQTLCCVSGERSPMCAPHSRCHKSKLLCQREGMVSCCSSEEKETLRLGNGTPNLATVSLVTV